MRAASSSRALTKRSPPCTRRRASTGRRYARRLSSDSTRTGWWTTTLLSTGGSSRLTELNRSSTEEPSAEIVGGSFPGRRQLLAGAHRDGLVVGVRSGRGRSRLRADRRERSRLGQGVSDLGGLPARPKPG